MHYQPATAADLRQTGGGEANRNNRTRCGPPALSETPPKPAERNAVKLQSSAPSDFVDLSERRSEHVHMRLPHGNSTSEEPARTVPLPSAASAITPGAAINGKARANNLT